MQVAPIQQSFASGQISGRVIGRTQDEIYQTGVLIARNVIPLLQGPLRSRCGFRNSGRIYEDNTRAVIFEFKRTVGEDLIVEVGDDSVVVRNRAGIVVEEFSENLFSDPDFRAGGQYNVGTRTQDAIVNGLPATIDTNFSSFPTLDIFPPPFKFWPYQVMAYLPGEFALTRVNPASTAVYSPPNPNINTCIRDLVFTPEPAELHQYTQKVVFPTQVNYNNPIPPTQLNATVIITADIDGLTVIHQETHTFTNYGEEYLFDFNFTPNVSEFWVTVGAHWSISPQEGYGVSIVEWYPRYCGYEISGGSASPIIFPSPYSASQLGQIQYAMDAASRELWLFHPDVEPHRLKLAGGLWSFEELTAISGYGGPAITGPEFNGIQGWPRTGCFHQGRLFLAGTRTYPNTVWGSRIFDYVDFDNTTVAAKDDPVVLPLTFAGNIEWIVSRGELVVGFDVGEGTIYAPAAGIIAFDDFKFDDHTYHGSSSTQAIVVGRKVIYTSPSRNRIRTFEKRDEIQGWDGEELSINHQEILLPQVQQIKYALNPENQLVVRLSNGTLAVATYDYNQKFIGWYTIDTSGAIEAIAVTRQNMSDLLWAVVERNGERFVEYMTYCESSVGASLDAFYQGSVPDDCFISTPELSHLIGREVSIVLRVRLPDELGLPEDQQRFTIHDKQIVQDNGGDGSVQLEDWTAGNTVFIGIPFRQYFKTLPPEGTFQGGTSQVTRQRYNKIFLRLRRSSIPLIDGKPPPERKDGNEMDSAPPFVTKDVTVENRGWKENQVEVGSIVVEQDLPLFFEVVGIFGKAAVKSV